MIDFDVGLIVGIPIILFWFFVFRSDFKKYGKKMMEWKKTKEKVRDL